MPSEEMVRAISIPRVIITNIIPSGKQIREFAPPYKASDTEAAEQCCEPNSRDQRDKKAEFLQGAIRKRIGCASGFDSQVRVTGTTKKEKHHDCGAFLWFW